jgi:prophage regulatory protein
MLAALAYGSQDLTGKTTHFQPAIYWNQPTMIRDKNTHMNQITPFNIDRAMRDIYLELYARSVIERRTTITDGFPEAGGGGAAAIDDAGADSTGGDGGAPAGAGDDDDDGGDGDGDPDRRSPRKTPKKTPSPSGEHRNATATAGDLHSIPKITPLVLRLPAVLATLGTSRSAWYLGIKQGRYPAPVRLGTRAVGWRTADILALVQNLTSTK